MKWVRCLYKGNYSDLTVGMFYEVLLHSHTHEGHFWIINDLGRTAEIRDNKIDCNVLSNSLQSTSSITIHFNKITRRIHNKPF